MEVSIYTLDVAFGPFFRFFLCSHRSPAMQHPFLAVIFAQIRARRPRRPLKLVLLSALAGGCSGSDASEAALASGRYAIVTTLFQADGQTSLLGVVDDPALPGAFDTGRAAEIGGAAALFGRDGRSVFAIGSSDSASVTRYVLSDDGVLEPRGALSLQPYGIGSAFKRPELVPFVSDTKAYWIDDTSQQVVLNRALVAAPPGTRLRPLREPWCAGCPCPSP
jgi:hypothetical protein